MKNKGMPKIIEKSKRIRIAKKAKEIFDYYPPAGFSIHNLLLFEPISGIYFIENEAYEEFRKKVEAISKGS